MPAPPATSLTDTPLKIEALLGTHRCLRKTQRVRGGAHNTCARICGERWSQLRQSFTAMRHICTRVLCAPPRARVISISGSVFALHCSSEVPCVLAGPRMWHSNASCHAAFTTPICKTRGWKLFLRRALKLGDRETLHGSSDGLCWTALKLVARCSSGRSYICCCCPSYHRA